MAHELTIRKNGFAEMAFVGQTPWHGLGQELAQDADMETWRKSAGMDWTIQSAPVNFSCITDSNTNPINRDFAGQNVLYRSDNGLPLSVVTNRYKPVQPYEVLEFFDALVKESGFRLHTAGTLFGGKRMWALAETGKFGEVSDGDGVGGFLLLSTSADRTLSTTARFTTVRVVCNNTLSMATTDKSHCVSFTHARKFDHDLMRAKLGKAVENFGAFMEMAKVLRKQKLNVHSANDFVANLLLTHDQWGDSLALENVRKSKGFNKIINLFEGEGKGSDMAGFTKWGMLNAVTEYYDHHIPTRTADARLNSTWFGTGDGIKQKAINLLTA
jgi:phage/plasmid-like protein (TIGR03299 family)